LAEGVRVGAITAKDALTLARGGGADDQTALMQNTQWIMQNNPGMTFEEALQLARSGQTINVGGGTQVGTIPQGYELVEIQNDDGTMSRQMRAIPGGPADTAENEQAQQEQSERARSVVLEDIGRVKDKIENAPWYDPATGLFGNMLSNIGGTTAFDTGALLRTVGGNIGFDRLQQMRDASPSGGALGAINQQELNLLMSVMGSLEQAQSEAQLLQNLDRLETIYTNIMNKAAAYPNASDFGFEPINSGDDDLTPDERRFLGLE